MNQEEVKAVGKKIVKGLGATLVLSLGVIVLVSVFDGLYDLRIALGVVACKFGFDLVFNQLGKIKGLE